MTKRWPRACYLYVATDGVHVKIGITEDPVQREQALRAKIIKLWRRPYAGQLESAIKGMFNCVRGTEWFDEPLDAFIRHVHRTIRILDDHVAIKRGREPSKRPEPGEPPIVPAFELSWSRPGDARLAASTRR